MKSYAVVIAAVFVVFLGLNAAFADDPPATEPAAPPAATPAPVPLPSVDDLIVFLKGEGEEDAKKAMDALVAKGEEAIQPLLDLQASGDAVGAPRATETLKRTGCVDGLYATAKLFRNEFAPFETIGVRFYFRNYSKNVIMVLNPVSVNGPETNFGLGWKMMLKDADGKKVSEMDMNAGVNATAMSATDFITLLPAGQLPAVLPPEVQPPAVPPPAAQPPAAQYGDRYDDIVYAHVLFGVDKIDMGSYVLEAEYYCKPDVLQDVKKRNDINVQALFEKNIVSPPIKFSVAVKGAGEVTPEKKAEIEKAIQDLGSGEYEVWTEAEKALSEAGAGALPLLKEAVRTTADPQIRYRAEQLINKIVQPPEEEVTYIGIGLTQMEQQEIKIQNVIPNSPADHGGIHPGDVVKKLNGALLLGDLARRWTYLRKYVQSLKEGDKLQLTVQREGEGEKVLEITVKKIAKSVLGQN